VAIFAHLALITVWINVQLIKPAVANVNHHWLPDSGMLEIGLL